MKYSNIIRAGFINRPNRFIAEVDIEGHTEIVHVKNTGRCKELLIPGCEVWLTAPGTPGRKTRYDLVAVRKSNGVLFNIDSQAPNILVKEWLTEQDYSKVIPEYKYGESRIDFYMERYPGGVDSDWDFPERKFAETVPPRHLLKSGPAETVPPRHLLQSGHVETAPERHLMEVKGCTLEINGIGYFPDAPTERGIKHIRELIKAKEAGWHAALAFVIQMDGVSEVRPNTEMHPGFGTAMEAAEKAGVKIIFLSCHVEPDEIKITEKREGTK